MPQAVYLCVMAWVGEVPLAALFNHIARWQLGNIAYAHLDFSIAAWSPSRAAVLQVAMRLLMSSGVRDVEHHERLAARVDRQQRRALGALPFLQPVDSITVQVRELVRSHRVERAVLAGLVHMHPHLLQDIAVLRDAAERRVVEDESSSSDEDEL